MSYLNLQPAWEAPPTPPLSPADVEKPVPAAPAAAAPSGHSPAAAMRELAALTTSRTAPPKAAEAACLGQSLLRSAAELLDMEAAHTALSADFEAKMDSWESSIYVSSSEDVKAARAAALETLEPLREAVAAVDAARTAWGALDALCSGPASLVKQFAAEFGQDAAVETGAAVARDIGPAGPAVQTELPMVESLIKYIGELTSSAAQNPPAPPPQQLDPLTFHLACGTTGPFHLTPPQLMLGGPQPAPVLLRSQPAAVQPIFGGMPLTDPRSSPPRRGPSPTLHTLGGDELGMMTPIVEVGPSLGTEGLDMSTVLAVAATGVPAWTAAPAHSGLEAADDPMFGLSHMLKLQLDAMFAAQQHSGGEESDGGAVAGAGGGRKSRAAEGEELEYADVLCAMGRDREEGGGEGTRGRGRQVWRDSTSREGGTTPATVSEAFTPGTSPETEFPDPEAQTRRERLVAAVAPFFCGATATAAPLPSIPICGVTRHKRTGKYEAHVWKGKKQSCLGSYWSQAAAARAHDIAAMAAGLNETRFNYPAADYVELKQLFGSVIDISSVVRVLKEVSRKQAGSGRGSVASGRADAVVGRKRGRPRATQEESMGPVKRKGPSERSPVA